MATIASSRVPATAVSQQQSPAATHPYTCNTCQVAFRNSELQRGHMRSDWHRYNLKRRVTSLPPISSEVFTEKVLAAQATTTAAANKATYEAQCEDCGRTYFSENAYINHLSSQKHKAKAAAGAKGGRHIDDGASSVISSTMSFSAPNNQRLDDGASSDDEVDAVADKVKQAAINDTKPPAADSGTQPEASLDHCLFCNQAAKNFPSNMQHMQLAHGLFVPERDFLVNAEGLFRHLFHKINFYHECIFCNKLNPSVFGLQTHMRDKSHCRIPFETEEQQLEIGDFYDFTSTYTDDEDDEPVTDKDAEDDDGEGWETDGSDDDASQRATKRAGAAYYDDYELHLPSGKSVGHRSLARYYRQNLHNHPSPAERAERLALEGEDAENQEEEERSGRGRALATRADGGWGMVGVTEEKKKEVRAVEKRARKVEQRERQRFEWATNRVANSQKFFRDPNLPGN